MAATRYVRTVLVFIFICIQTALAQSPSGSEFQVNSYTTSMQTAPAVAMDADGDFVVVWESDGSNGTDTSYSSIQGQRYSADGTPQGTQFQVNTTYDEDQVAPAVAMDDDGDFVVVWQSHSANYDPGPDTAGAKISGQRFLANGNPSGSEFQVNTYYLGDQTAPSVAMDADGDFVVVWESGGSSGTDTSGYSIQGQRFLANGNPSGSEFQVNTTYDENQLAPGVAMDDDGDFVIVWESYSINYNPGPDTAGAKISGQRFLANGNPSGSEFQVNTYYLGDQTAPSVAMDADGDFVVVWGSNGSNGTDTSGFSIQGQRFLANGNPSGNEFQVNTTYDENQLAPAVAMDDDGDFVIAWESHSMNYDPGPDTSGAKISAQKYSADGTPQKDERQVNTYYISNQSAPSIAMDDEGNFVVTWQSDGSGGTDTSSFSIQGQRYRNADSIMPSVLHILLGQ